MFEFEDVGGTIKALAKVVCLAGILISLIVGFGMLSPGCGARYTDARDGVGLVVMIVGPISSWISSIFIYGFGELIEKTTEIAKNIKDLRSTIVDTDDVNSDDVNPDDRAKRLKRFEKWIDENESPE